MKKYLILSILFIVSMKGRTQPSEGNSPFIVKSFANSAIQDVLSKTSGGSIDISGINNNADWRVEVYIQSSNGRAFNLSKEEIQKRLDNNYVLTISLDEKKLTATAKAKNDFFDRKHSLNISFRIFVPQHVSSDLSTSGGSIHLINLTGKEEFNTSGGSLHIEQLSGKIQGKTSGGGIFVRDAKDDIDLSTSGGSIEAINCQGVVKLNTSGGSLKLDDLKGTITANTSGGGVHGNNIEGELATTTSGGSITLRELKCSLEASTSGGHIDVEIKELGKFVKLRNSGGKISLQIPSNKGLDLKLYAEKIQTASFSNFSGTVDKNKIEGILNGGGIPVTVHADGGNLFLSFR